MADIIFAPATAKGKAALSIIRVSGEGSGTLLKMITNKGLPENRVIALRSFYNPKSKKIIDTCLVAWMVAPRTYTGEDSFEIYCHGSISIVRSFFDSLSSCENVRLAEEGEFTKRALINGKLNLIKAEAINDLVNSETESQRILALKQLNKGLTVPIKKWKKTLRKIMAKVESVIDFSDEEDVPDNLNIKKELSILKYEFEKVLKNSASYELIKEGTKVVLTGKPNAGKSTLFNALLNSNKSIVTNIPGTTRDIIEAAVNLKGYPIIFYDTAGINNTNNPIEKEGINRAINIIKEADIVLNVIDANTFQKQDISHNYWNLINKIDTRPILSENLNNEKNIQKISASSGIGIDNLQENILNHVMYKTDTIKKADTFLSSARQKMLLTNSLESINFALQEKSEELVAESLRAINYNLGRILGEVDVEEVLGEIFSNFCIGK